MGEKDCVTQKRKQQQMNRRNVIAVLSLAVLMWSVSGCTSPKQGAKPIQVSSLPTRVTSFLTSGRECLSLTNLQPVASTVGWGKFTVNVHALGDGRQPIIESSLCSEYLAAHAPSALEYEIPAGFKRFFAVGYSVCDSRSMQFIVKCDYNVIFASKSLETYPEGYVVIDVSIPEGAKKLTLTVDPLGDFSYDCSTWCYPRFYK